MKNFLVIIVFLLPIIAFGQDTLYTHSALIPWNGEQPIDLGATKIDSSKLFIVAVYKDSLIIQFGYNSMEFNNLQELENFIKNNISKIEKQECSIKANDKIDNPRVKDVIDVFQKNNIKGFAFISN
jgi:hypothetical protein